MVDVKELTAEQEDIMLESGMERHYEDEEIRQIANEVDEGRFECWIRDSNKEDLRDRFIAENQKDFDEWCRNEYEMFKND